MKKLVLFIVLTILLSGCGSQKPPADDQTDITNSESITDVKQEDRSIEEIALALVTDVTKGEYEKAYNEYIYDSKMKKAISVSFFKDQFWTYLISTYGDFKEITGTKTSETDGYRIVTVKMTFSNLKIDLNVVFDKDGKIAGINFKPDTDISAPIPEGVIEKEVSFGKTGWELPAVLTMPKDGKQCPVVILVQGSGPNDKDETVGPNKPFRDIAWGLAQKGIASLRYDKRTYVYGQKMAADPKMTVNDETVEDAALAVQYLMESSDITPGKIYILGHSLGGMMMPRIAEQAAQASGYIIVSGSVTPLEDLMVEQVNYISSLDGSISPQEKLSVKAYEKMRDNVKGLSQGSNMSANQLFGIPPAYWLDLQNYRPAELAKNIDKPLLILQGERDYQVTMKEFNLWKEAVGDMANVTMRSYAGLNHLLMNGSEKSSPQEYNIPGQVDQRVIDDISNWILDMK